MQAKLSKKFSKLPQILTILGYISSIMSPEVELCIFLSYEKYYKQILPVLAPRLFETVWGKIFKIILKVISNLVDHCEVRYVFLKERWLFIKTLTKSINHNQVLPPGFSKLRGGLNKKSKNTSNFVRYFWGWGTCFMHPSE